MSGGWQERATHLVAELRVRESEWLNVFDNFGSPEIELDWDRFSEIVRAQLTQPSQ